MAKCCTGGCVSRSPPETYRPLHPRASRHLVQAPDSPVGFGGSSLRLFVREGSRTPKETRKLISVRYDAVRGGSCFRR